MSMRHIKDPPISSTLLVPKVDKIPNHIAIIMDGNGRWAEKKKLPRNFGHERGVASLKRTVEACLKLRVKSLTVFAFSSENWRRPEHEISFLMLLFKKSIKKEIENLKKHGIRLKILGDIEALSYQLQDLIVDAQSSTENNTELNLNVAINYGGRWDILQAIRKMIDHSPQLIDKKREIREEDFSPHLQINELSEPDLFIRTGGEKRVSNFLLWQLAYTELYFTDVLWPEFGANQLILAINSYQKRERRFGRAPISNIKNSCKSLLKNNFEKNKTNTMNTLSLLDSFKNNE
tara:strand:+ start:1075 stop:1947 length:873 start_codon:yes stop_codon:yes gene_type:complete